MASSYSVIAPSKILEARQRVAAEDLTVDVVRVRRQRLVRAALGVFEGAGD